MRLILHFCQSRFKVFSHSTVPLCCWTSIGQLSYSWKTDPVTQNFCVLIFWADSKGNSKQNRQAKNPFWKGFLKCYLINGTFVNTFYIISVLLRKIARSHLYKPWVASGVDISMILPARDSDQCSTLKKDCSNRKWIPWGLAPCLRKGNMSTGLCYQCLHQLRHSSQPAAGQLGQQQAWCFHLKSVMHKFWRYVCKGLLK